MKPCLHVKGSGGGGEGRVCVSGLEAISTQVCMCLQALHGKQGKKYSSKKERDDSLKAEVKQLQETLRKQQDNRDTLQAQVGQLSSACMDKSQDIGNQQAAIQQRKENLARCDR